MKYVCLSTHNQSYVAVDDKCVSYRCTQINTCFERTKCTLLDSCEMFSFFDFAGVDICNVFFMSTGPTPGDEWSSLLWR